MTVVAGDPFVCSVQNEISLCIVIEQPQLPVDRVMAQAAVVAITIFVVIVLGMAGQAFRFRQSELPGLMAIFASDIHVLAQQWKSRQAVVEADILSPCVFVMAVLTLLALL